MILYPFTVVYFTIAGAITAEEVLYKYKKNDKRLKDNAALVVAESFRDSWNYPVTLFSLYSDHVTKNRNTGSTRTEHRINLREYPEEGTEWKNMEE